MGFLDHSTNNIILDAVLTDTGREQLAKGAGTFNIAKFAFGDDEVDYGIIKEFGRTVGKEKIEKLTPVLEASTSGYLGIKYRNVSLNNSNLTLLPILSLTTDFSKTGGKAELNRSTRSNQTNQSVTIEQQLPAGVLADGDIADFSFRVTVDNTFLSIQNAVPDNVDSYNNATYTIPARGALSPQNLTSMTFTLVAKAVSSDIFDTFSHVESGKTVVSRVCKVSGANSGQFISFDVDIL